MTSFIHGEFHWLIRDQNLNYCMLDDLFKLTLNKASQPVLLTPCKRNPLVTDGFSSLRTSNAEKIHVMTSSCGECYVTFQSVVYRTYLFNKSHWSCMPSTHHANMDCVADRKLSRDPGICTAVRGIYSQLVFMTTCWSVIWYTCREKTYFSRKRYVIDDEKLKRLELISWLFRYSDFENYISVKWRICSRQLS